MAIRLATGDDALWSLLASSWLFESRWGDIPNGKLYTARLHIADLVEKVESVRTLREQMLTVAETGDKDKTGCAAHDQVGEIFGRSPILTKRGVECFAQSVLVEGETSLSHPLDSCPGAQEFEVYHNPNKIGANFKNFPTGLAVSICRNLRIRFRQNAKFPIFQIRCEFELRTKMYGTRRCISYLTKRYNQFKSDTILLPLQKGHSPVVCAIRGTY